MRATVHAGPGPARIEVVRRRRRRQAPITPPESPRTLALLRFFVYAGAARWWIAQDRPGPDAGLADLRVALVIQVRAPGATPGKRPRTPGARSRTS